MKDSLSLTTVLLLLLVGLGINYTYFSSPSKNQPINALKQECRDLCDIVCDCKKWDETLLLKDVFIVNDSNKNNERKKLHNIKRSEMSVLRFNSDSGEFRRTIEIYKPGYSRPTYQVNANRIGLDSFAKDHISLQGLDCAYIKVDAKEKLYVRLDAIDLERSDYDPKTRTYKVVLKSTGKEYPVSRANGRAHEEWKKVVRYKRCECRKFGCEN